MTDNSSKRPIADLGVFSRRGAGTLSSAEVIALVLSGLWLLAAVIFFFLVRDSGPQEPDPVRGLLIVLAVAMPIALIWIAAMAATSAKIVRDEAARLQAAMDAMRQSSVAQQQMSGMSIKSSLEKKLDDLMAAQRATDAKLATFATSRPQDAVPAAVSGAEPATVPLASAQADLGLISDAPRETPLSVEDFITALNFPKTTDDVAGFRALKRAMRDRRASQLVQAAQDILTLLSQDGIYMDDLTPDRARPEVWRMFAEGERGRAIAALGGIRDRSGIALTAARMRQDNIFRDTAHHFLRKFDQIFSQFAEHASDAEIAALSDTRTARCFMLLGRVAGTFD